uniref:Uncharacterized protein n=1 Tax=Ditylenchus dipsaci TaxID=166011 RepID=A0A915ELF4_9BILA
MTFLCNQHAIQEAHDNTVWDGAFDVSGNFLATCGADCAIKVWKKNEQPVEGRRWTKLLDHPILDTRWPLYSISWNHESAIIAVGGGDCTIRFFSLDEENSALTLLNIVSLDAEINCLRWNPVEKNVLGAACDDGTCLKMDCDVASYHIESYNFMADEGLQLAAENVPTTKLRLPSGDAVEISYAALRLGYPALESSSSLSDATKNLPR